MTRAFNDARGSFHNEPKLLCALPPEGGTAAGEGEVGMETGAYTVKMLTHQHAMHAEPRSALGCPVASIWINSYHGVVGDERR
jgi:hypothetical protein